METKEETDGKPSKKVRSARQAMKRGFQQKCPNCRKAPLFDEFLKVTKQCSHCSTELHHHRADDAPPYFTIFIVGHIIIPLVLFAEKYYHPNLWVHAALWPPLTIAITLYFLPRVKGAVVGLQWAKYMHGFDPDYVEGDNWSGA